MVKSSDHAKSRALCSGSVSVDTITNGKQKLLSHTKDDNDLINQTINKHFLGNESLTKQVIEKVEGNELITTSIKVLTKRDGKVNTIVKKEIKNISKLTNSKRKMILQAMKDHIQGITRTRNIGKTKIRPTNNIQLVLSPAQTRRKLLLILHSDKINNDSYFSNLLIILINLNLDSINDLNTLKEIAFKYQNWGQHQLAYVIDKPSNKHTQMYCNKVVKNKFVTNKHCNPNETTHTIKTSIADYSSNQRKIEKQQRIRQHIESKLNVTGGSICSLYRKLKQQNKRSVMCNTTQMNRKLHVAQKVKGLLNKLCKNIRKKQTGVKSNQMGRKEKRRLIKLIKQQEQTKDKIVKRAKTVKASELQIDQPIKNKIEQFLKAAKLVQSPLIDTLIKLIENIIDRLHKNRYYNLIGDYLWQIDKTYHLTKKQDGLYRYTAVKVTKLIDCTWADAYEIKTNEQDQVYADEPEPVEPEKVETKEWVKKSNASQVKIGGKGNCWSLLPLRANTGRRGFVTGTKSTVAVEKSAQSIFDELTNKFKPDPSWNFMGGIMEMPSYNSKKYTFSKVNNDMYHIDNGPNPKHSLIDVYYLIRDALMVEETKYAFVGLGKDNVVQNRVDKEIVEALGDVTSARYKEIVDDHDTRLVRIHYSSTENTTLVTCRPRKDVLEYFSGIMSFTIQANKTCIGNQNLQFNTDVATWVAYTNCNPADLCYDVKTLEMLCKQPDFKINENTKGNVYLGQTIPKDLLDYEILHIIVPAVGSNVEGELQFDAGTYKFKNDKLFWSGHGTNNINEIQGINFLLRGQNNCIIDDIGLHKVSVKYVGCMQILTLTTLAYNSNRTSENELITFEVPTLQNASALLNTPLMTYETVQLNKDLLNRLINRNLTMTVSDDSMIEYAMALSWYSYNKRGVELATTKITPEMAKSHLYVAKVLLMRQRIKTELDDLVFSVEYGGPAIVAMASTVVNQSLKNWKEPASLKKIVQMATKILSGVTLTNDNNQVSDAWDGIDVWRSTRIQTVGSSNSISTCGHHGKCKLPLTINTCACCGEYTAKQNEIFCKCCKVESKCQHECTLEHNGDMICKCCGKLSVDEICNCCTLVEKFREEIVHVNRVNESSDERKNKKFTSEKKNTKVTKELEGKGKITKCEICLRSYLSTEENNSCSWCDMKSKAIKLVNKQDEPHTMEMMSAAHYLTVLTPNTVETLKNDKNYRICNASTVSHEKSFLPFMTKSTSYSPVDFELVDELKVQGVADCGYESMQYFLRNTLSEMKAKSLTGKIENYNPSDFLKIMSAEGVNTIILTKMTVWVSIVETSDEYAVIVHSDWLNNGTTNHWMPAKVQLRSNKLIEGYGSQFNTPQEHNKLCAHMFQTDYHHATNAMKLTVSFTLADRIIEEIFSDCGSFSYKNGIVSNTQKTDPSVYGDYHFEVPDEFRKYCDAINSSIAKQGIVDDLNQTWDINPQNADDLKYQIDREFMSACKSIANMLIGKASTLVVPCQVIIVNKKCYINLSEHKIKRGDLIHVLMRGKIEPIICTPNKDGYLEMKSSHITSGARVNIIINRQSFISTILTLKQCSIAYNQLSNTKEHLFNVIEGYAGAGKTTTVSRIVNEAIQVNKELRVTVVTCTTSARLGFGSKIPISARLTSLENAMARPFDCDLLVIDEATMVKPWQILSLASSCGGEIYVLGDEMQIGGDSFEDTPGIRFKLTGLGYAKKHAKNIDKITEVHRYGNPLASELAKHPAISDLKTGAAHTTSVEVKNLLDVTPTDITSFFAECDVILCFYVAHKNMLKSIFGPVNKRIETAAAYQGIGADVVGVYQAPSANKNATLHNDFTYCFSAATRAVTALKWLSVKSSNNNETLVAKLGSSIGYLPEALQYMAGIMHNSTFNAERIGEYQQQKFKPAGDTIKWCEIDNKISHGYTRSTINEDFSVYANLVSTHSILLELKQILKVLENNTWIKQKLTLKLTMIVKHGRLEPSVSLHGKYDQISFNVVLKIINGCMIFERLNAEANLITNKIGIEISQDEKKICEFIQTLNCNDSLATNVMKYFEIYLTTGGFKPQSEKYSSDSLKWQKLLCDNIHKSIALNKSCENYMTWFKNTVFPYNGIDSRHEQLKISCDMLGTQLSGRRRNVTAKKNTLQVCTPEFTTIEWKNGDLFVDNDNNDAKNLYLLSSILNFSYDVNVKINSSKINLYEAGGQPIGGLKNTCLLALASNKPSPIKANMDKFDVNMLKELVEKHNTSGYKVTIDFSKQNELFYLEFTAHGIPLIRTATNTLVLDVAGNKISGNLKYNEQETLKTIPYLCYLEQSIIEGQSIKAKKRVNTRARILAYLARTYQLNNEEYIVTTKQGVFKILTDIDNCAACASITFYEKIDNKYNKICILSDAHDVSSGRRMYGTKMSVINDWLSGPYCELIPSEIDTTDVTTAILAERVSWYIDIKNLILNKHPDANTFFENQITVNAGKKFLKKNIVNDRYNDLKHYGFWNCSGKNKEIVTEMLVTSKNEIKFEQFAADSKMNRLDVIITALSELMLNINSQSIAKGLSRIFVNQLGAIDRLEGMMEPFVWHKANQTNTAYELSSRATKNLVKAEKFSRPDMSVPNPLHNYISKTLLERGYSNNGRDLNGPIAQLSAELICALAIYDTTNCETLVDGLNIMIPFVLDQPNIKVSVDISDNNNKVDRMVLLPLVETMINARLRREPADGKNYNRIASYLNDCKMNVELPKQGANSNLLLGPMHCKKDIQKLVKFTQHHNRVFIILPSDITTSNGNVIASFKEDSCNYLVGKELLHYFKTGNEITGTDYRLNIVSTYAGFYLLEFKTSGWMSDSDYVHQFECFDLPTIITNPMEILDKKDIFKTKKYWVNIAVVNNLHRRAMKPGTTMEDLLVQARTLINTAQFSTTTVASRYNVNVADAYVSARIAFYTARQLDKKYSMLTVEFEDNILMHGLKQAGWLMLGKVSRDILGEIDIDRFKHIFEDMLPDSGFKTCVIHFMNVLSKISLSCLRARRVLKVDGQDRPTDVVMDITMNQVIPKIIDILELSKRRNNLLVYVDSNCKHCTNHGIANVVTLMTNRIPINNLKDVDSNSKIVQICSVKCDHKNATRIQFVNDETTSKETIKYSYLSTVCGPRIDDLENTNVILGHRTHEGYIVNDNDDNVLNFIDIISEYHPNKHIYPEINTQTILVGNEWNTESFAIASNYINDCTIIFSDKPLLYNFGNRNRYKQRIFDEYASTFTDVDIELMENEKYIKFNKKIDKIPNIKFNGTFIDKNWNKEIKQIPDLDTNTIFENKKITSDCIATSGHNGEMAQNNMKKFFIAKWLKLTWGSGVTLRNVGTHYMDKSLLDDQSINAKGRNILNCLSEICEQSVESNLVNNKNVNVMSYKAETIRLYVVDKNMNRSFNNKIEGIHLCFVTKNHPLCNDPPSGINVIELPFESFGIFGAGLRIILACLLASDFAYTQVMDGRPYWKKSIYELWLANLHKTTELTRKGVVFSNHNSWSTDASCAIFDNSNWSYNDKLNCIKCILNYGMYYGVDEMTAKWWPVKLMLYNNDETVPYSFVDNDVKDKWSFKSIDNKTNPPVGLSANVLKHLNHLNECNGLFKQLGLVNSISLDHKFNKNLSDSRNKNNNNLFSTNESELSQEVISCLNIHCDLNMYEPDNNGFIGNKINIDLNRNAINDNNELNTNNKNKEKKNNELLSDTKPTIVITNNVESNVIEDTRNPNDKLINTVINNMFEWDARDEEIIKAGKEFIRESNHLNKEIKYNKEFVLKVGDMALCTSRKNKMNYENLIDDLKSVINKREYSSNLVTYFRSPMMDIIHLLGFNEKRFIIKLFVGDDEYQTQNCGYKISNFEYDSSVDVVEMVDENTFVDQRYAIKIEMDKPILIKKILKHNLNDSTTNLPRKTYILNGAIERVKIDHLDEYPSLEVDKCGPFSIRTMVKHSSRIVSSINNTLNIAIDSLGKYTELDKIIGMLLFLDVNFIIVDRRQNDIVVNVSHIGDASVFEIKQLSGVIASHITYRGEISHDEFRDMCRYDMETNNNEIKKDYFMHNVATTQEQISLELGTTPINYNNNAKDQCKLNMKRINESLLDPESSIPELITDDNVNRISLRLHGSYLLVACRNGKPFTLTQCRMNDDFVVSENLSPNSIYLFRSKDRWIPLYAGINENNEAVLVRYANVDYNVCINVGLNFSSRKNRGTNITVSNMSFLNRMSKQLAVSIEDNHANVELGFDADICLAYVYDGSDHHNSKDRTKLIDQLSSGKSVQTKCNWINNLSVNELLSFLQATGPIRLGWINEKAYFMSSCDGRCNVITQETINMFINNIQSELSIAAELIQNVNSWGWIKSGNRWAPQLSDDMDQNQIEHPMKRQFLNYDISKSQAELKLIYGKSISDELMKLIEHAYTSNLSKVDLVIRSMIRDDIKYINIRKGEKYTVNSTNNNDIAVYDLGTMTVVEIKVVGASKKADMIDKKIDDLMMHMIEDGDEVMQDFKQIVTLRINKFIASVIPPVDPSTKPKFYENEFLSGINRHDRIKFFLLAPVIGDSLAKECIINNVPYNVIYDNYTIDETNEQLSNASEITITQSNIHDHVELSTIGKCVSHIKKIAEISTKNFELLKIKLEKKIRQYITTHYTENEIGTTSFETNEFLKGLNRHERIKFSLLTQVFGDDLSKEIITKKIPFELIFENYGVNYVEEELILSDLSDIINDERIVIFTLKNMIGKLINKLSGEINNIEIWRNNIINKIKSKVNNFNVANNESNITGDKIDNYFDNLNRHQKMEICILRPIFGDELSKSIVVNEISYEMVFDCCELNYNDGKTEVSNDLSTTAKETINNIMETITELPNINENQMGLCYIKLFINPVTKEKSKGTNILKTLLGTWPSLSTIVQCLSERDANILLAVLINNFSKDELMQDIIVDGKLKDGISIQQAVSITIPNCMLHINDEFVNELHRYGFTFKLCIFKLHLHLVKQIIKNDSNTIHHALLRFARRRVDKLSPSDSVTNYKFIIAKLSVWLSGISYEIKNAINKNFSNQYDNLESHHLGGTNDYLDKKFFDSMNTRKINSWYQKLDTIDEEFTTEEKQLLEFEINDNSDEKQNVQIVAKNFKIELRKIRIPGYCYLQLFNENCHDMVSDLLGRYPSIASIMCLIDNDKRRGVLSYLLNLFEDDELFITPEQRVLFGKIVYHVNISDIDRERYGIGFSTFENKWSTRMKLVKLAKQTIIEMSIHTGDSVTFNLLKLVNQTPNGILKEIYRIMYYCADKLSIKIGTKLQRTLYYSRIGGTGSELNEKLSEDITEFTDVTFKEDENGMMIYDLNEIEFVTSEVLDNPIESSKMSAYRSDLTHLPGYCYLSLFTFKCRNEIATMLGPQPTIQQVLCLIDDDKMDDVNNLFDLLADNKSIKPDYTGDTATTLHLDLNENELNKLSVHLSNFSNRFDKIKKTIKLARINIIQLCIKTGNNICKNVLILLNKTNNQKMKSIYRWIYMGLTKINKNIGNNEQRLKTYMHIGATNEQVEMLRYNNNVIDEINMNEDSNVSASTSEFSNSVITHRTSEINNEMIVIGQEGTRKIQQLIGHSAGTLHTSVPAEYSTVGNITIDEMVHSNRNYDHSTKWMQVLNFSWLNRGKKLNININWDFEIKLNITRVAESEENRMRTNSNITNMRSTSESSANARITSIGEDDDVPILNLDNLIEENENLTSSTGKISSIINMSPEFNSEVLFTYNEDNEMEYFKQPENNNAAENQELSEDEELELKVVNVEDYFRKKIRRKILGVKNNSKIKEKINLMNEINEFSTMNGSFNVGSLNYSNEKLSFGQMAARLLACIMNIYNNRSDIINYSTDTLRNKIISLSSRGIDVDKIKESVTGYCYLSLFMKNEWIEIAELLGPWPKLSSILILTDANKQQILTDYILNKALEHDTADVHINDQDIYKLTELFNFEKQSIYKIDGKKMTKLDVAIKLIAGRVFNNITVLIGNNTHTIVDLIKYLLPNVGEKLEKWIVEKLMHNEIEVGGIRDKQDSKTSDVEKENEAKNRLDKLLKDRAQPANTDENRLHTIEDIRSNKFEQVIGKNKERIVNLDDKPINTISQETINLIETVNCVNNTAITDWTPYPDIGLGKNGTVDILVGNSNYDCPINVEVSDAIIAPRIINFWEDQTAMVDGVIPLPKRDINLRGGEIPTNLTEVEKTTLVKYPTHGQPNYTVRSFAPLQAMSELFGSKLELREVQHNPIEDADKFVNTYFQHGGLTALPQINIDHNKILEWLKERPDNTKIARDIDQILSEGWDIHGLDRVNVHLKLESRMKDVMLKSLDEINMPETIDDQRVRLIVWQRKGITSIFAGVFLQAKEHLKRVLPENVLYADGLTPKELAAKFNRCRSEDLSYVEDDLAKQDRQTDMTLIKTEMEIYKRLGVNPGVVDIWESVHHSWKAKGCGYKFDGDASRLTGQATTAIGNAIVNLMVKEKLVRDLGKNLVLMAVLGDDNIMLVKGNITESQVKLHSARHFNMVSKPEITKTGGTFLRMIVCPGPDGYVEVGPDLVRLRRKFEVTNGVAEGNELNLLMRKLSYCCMIGKNNETERIVKGCGYDVPLQKWYNYSSIRKATSLKYGCSIEEIDDEYYRLIDTIESDRKFSYKKMMFVSKKS